MERFTWAPPCACVCLSGGQEGAWGRVGLCLCVSSRGFAQRQVRGGDAQLAEEGEVCTEAHGRRHPGCASCVWPVGVPVGGRGWMRGFGCVRVCGCWCLCVFTGVTWGVCTHVHSCVCVSRPTSDLFRSKRTHSGGTWRRRGQTSCRHPHSPSLSLSLFFFYPFLSIDRHI